MVTSPGVTLTLASLTAARVTRLIVRDQFPPVRWAREKIEDHGPEWLTDLVSCVWCTSAYVSAGVVSYVRLRERRGRRTALAGAGGGDPVLMFGAVWAISATLAYWQGRAEDADEPGPEPEDESEMATMVSLERQVAPNSHVRG